MGIKEFFGWDDRRETVVPSILRFPLLDVEGLAKKLSLHEKGRTNGEREVPHPNANAFDSVDHREYRLGKAQGRRNTP